MLTKNSLVLSCDFGIVRVSPMGKFSFTVVGEVGVLILLVDDVALTSKESRVDSPVADCCELLGLGLMLGLKLKLKWGLKLGLKLEWEGGLELKLVWGWGLAPLGAVIELSGSKVGMDDVGGECEGALWEGLLL